MRVLMLHTFYRQRGGEDSIFAAELALLRNKGHEVLVHTLHNRDLEGMPRSMAALRTLWNADLHRDLRSLIRQSRPDVVHLQNTFPLASPSAISAAKAEHVPVVMTLQNYRLLCLDALLFRHGRLCEDCLGRLPWRGVVHGCYRGRSGSALVAAMLVLHRALRTWEKVDRFIAATDYSRRKLVQGGLNCERVEVKPNFLHPDPGPGTGRGGYALFAGRLSAEKGIVTLLRAWAELKNHIPLRIAGDGPLAGEVSEAVKRLPGTSFLGYRGPEEILHLAGEASFLAVPSEWYEAFPMVVIEAFARGTPVVASSIGALAEIIDEGRTGLHFLPGDPANLAAKVSWLGAHANELGRMRREARADYEAKYTGEHNYRMLLGVYNRAIEHSKAEAG